MAPRTSRGASSSEGATASAPRARGSRRGAPAKKASERRPKRRSASSRAGADDGDDGAPAPVPAASAYESDDGEDLVLDEAEVARLEAAAEGRADESDFFTAEDLAPLVIEEPRPFFDDDDADPEAFFAPSPRAAAAAAPPPGATDTTGDEALARELAEQFAMEDLQEQRRALLGGLAVTLVARASRAGQAAGRSGATPRSLLRDRQLMAEVSSTMSMLHSLMPALEATGLIPAMAMGGSPPPPAAPAGLTAAELDALPRAVGVDRPRFVDQEDSEEDGCPICLNDIAPDEEVMVLPCAHSFHTKCVSDWLKRKTLCPCCNSDVAKVVREDAGEGNARDAHRSDY